MWCAFAGRGVGTRAVVARRVRALQLLACESPQGHLWLSCLSPWMEGLKLFVAASSPWLCQMLAWTLAPCLGSFHQPLGTHGTHHTLPTEMELPRPCSGQSGSELAGTMGDSDWQMLLLSSTVWIPPVIFV